MILLWLVFYDVSLFPGRLFRFYAVASFLEEQELRAYFE